MISLREAAIGLLAVVEAAIKSGDWKVDGSCDPTVEIIRLKNALSKPWVGLTDENLASCLPGAARIPPGWRQTAQAIEAKLKEKNT